MIPEEPKQNRTKETSFLEHSEEYYEAEKKWQERIKEQGLVYTPLKVLENNEKFKGYLNKDG